MRALTLLLAIVAVAAATSSGAASSPSTQLSIVYWDEGQGEGERTIWTLRCNPVGGTLTGRVAACRALTRPGARALFAPTPKDMACTEIFGGPQVAFVSGTLQGRRLWARLSRANGCEIGRWDRLRFLLPAGGA